MPVLREAMSLGDLVKWEAEGRFSREVVTVAAGGAQARSLVLGQVIGRIALGAATATAHPDNAGDGTMGEVVAGALARAGDYLLTCEAAAANGGQFRVATPDGTLLPPAQVGTPYAGGHLNFTLADGAADFQVGDRFTVRVAAGPGKVKALDPAAVDGSQHAAGVMLQEVTAPADADALGVALVRDARVAPSRLAWPEGIGEGARQAALARLAALGIITGEEA